MTEWQRKIPLHRLLLMMIILVLYCFLPLIVSWQWDWWEGWAYAFLSLGSFVIGRGLVALHNPDLFIERANYAKQEGGKSWDKILSPLVAFGSGLIAFVAGLDMRFGWSNAFGLPVEIIALVIMLAGLVLANYALIKNRFFSGIVRIQADRGHVVVSTGPYRWIRHPGYSGTLLAFLTIPFFLDSVWAVIPAVIISIILVIRTALEDKTLKEELDGYPEYAQQVRYRLVPGIW